MMTTGAVFTALAAPVVMFADTPISLTQGKSQVVYEGNVRDAALPYLMLAGATSVGLGISGVAMAGWRKSAKQAEKLESSLQTQAEQRAERKAHLEAALASDSYLEKTGLNFFLEDGELTPFEPERLPITEPTVVAAQPTPMAITPQPELASVAPRTATLEEMDLAAQLAWLDGSDVPAPQSIPTPAHRPIEVATPATAATTSIQASHVAAPMSAAPVIHRTHVQHPVAQLPQHSQPAATSPTAKVTLTAAQGFYGFTRNAPQTSGAQPKISGGAPPQDQLTIDRIQSLQSQLQEIVTQIEALQANLPVSNERIQVVEDLASAQSGLVQPGFEVATEIPHNDRHIIQPIRRVAS